MRNDGSKWWQLESLARTNAINQFPAYFKVAIMKETKEYFWSNPILGDFQKRKAEPNR